MVRILGIGGGLREGSYSLAALRTALTIATEQGAETAILNLNECSFPLFRPDYALEEYGVEAVEHISRLLDGVRWAEGLIWASPAYHGAVTGAMKNALDYLQLLSRDEPPYLYNKTVGMISVGTGTIGAINVVTQLTQIAHALRAQVVPLLVPIPGAKGAFDGDRLTDTSIRQRLEGMVAELVRLAEVAPGPRLTHA